MPVVRYIQSVTFCYILQHTDIDLDQNYYTVIFIVP